MVSGIANLMGDEHTCVQQMNFHYNYMYNLHEFTVYTHELISGTCT